LIGDKAYDADPFVETLTQRGITPVIPPKANRKTKRACDFALYCERNLVDIDQSWRLSRFCGLVAGMGGRWWQATPRSRRCSYLFQGSDGGGIGVHQFSAAGASFDHAAA